ncbi:carboxypeptidase-like regulatory domain-containing protein [candidate division CSSED10-310 bacterium]|uniref:Carboxypeptidase-like regulatory domain-containing protein n=1 Tax=candidate division CSSED10-310 bacterium TaxID=2855610 RepID=A0ABV6YR49_UNCC1
MKQTIKIYPFFCYIFALSMFMSSCYNFSKEFRGDLEGKVVLRNTDIPIPDVEITVESLKDSSWFTSTTDEEGNFYFPDVHFGLNKVVFKKKRYHILTKYADILNDDTFLLDVELRAAVRPILIFVPIRIENYNSGWPIEKATVDIYLRRGTEEAPYWDYLTTQHTDEMGETIVFLGSLGRKQTFEVEARVAAPGYYEGILNFTVYFRKKQGTRTLALYPYDY